MRVVADNKILGAWGSILGTDLRRRRFRNYRIFISALNIEIAESETDRIATSRLHPFIDGLLIGLRHLKEEDCNPKAKKKDRRRFAVMVPPLHKSSQKRLASYAVRTNIAYRNIVSVIYEASIVTLWEMLLH